MPLFPQWSWLPVRSAQNGHSSETSIPSRPCIPSVEKLDPRVLFDTTTIDPIVIEKHIDKTTPLLALAESTALTPVDGESTDAKHKGEFSVLANDFLQLNSIFAKFHDDILNAKVSPTEMGDVTQAVNDIFVKIDFLATDLDGGSNKILPAVQDLRNIVLGPNPDAPTETLSLNFNKIVFDAALLPDLASLVKLDVASIPAGERSLFVKLNDEFWKLDEFAVDFKADLIRGVPFDVAQSVANKKFDAEYIKIKLDQVLISSYLTPDTFDGVVKWNVGLIESVINPDTSPGPILDTTFTGGVTVPGAAGDTIV